MKKTFSIIIPSWNNLPYLKNCIESLQKNSQFEHQIIVHINEGTDGTLEYVQKNKTIEYTYSRENIGVCHALNKARILVCTNYILYMNDDMYVCPNWDTYILDEINKQKDNLFFFSSTVIEPKATSNCVIEKNYGTSIKNFDEKRLLSEFQNLTFNDWFGATWPPNIVPVALWDLVGGYSIEFSPGMYSDPDFSMKLYKAGVRNFKGIHKSRVYHFGSKSTKRIKKNNGYYQFINKWGFTSSVLTKKILKRGEPYEGFLDANYKMSSVIKIKSIFKRVIAQIKREI